APSGELSPSTVIAELRGMLCENGKPIDIARIDFLRISSFSNSERDKTVGAMFSTEQACLYQILKNATHGVAQGDEFEIYRSAYKFVADGDKLKLENAIDEPEFLDKPQNSVKAEYASVSRLERFFTCPYSYFLNYDLKLKKRHEGDFDGNENGIILHYIFEKFYCGLRDGNVNCDNIEDMAYKFFDEAICENKFQRLMQKSATSRVLYRVREEGAVACRDLYNIYLRSAFKPTYVEAKIGNGEIKPLSINVDGRDVKLVGKIDRVDTYDDNFIIVDYKTYKNADLSLGEIYYGEKIQLYIYMKAVMNGSNLKPAGVFYLPVFASFTNADDNVNRYKFKGQASNNIDMLSKIDSMVLEDPEASIAPYKANKGKLKAETHFGENEFEAVSNYVCDLAASGIKKIEEGYIKPAPLKGACDMCNFAEMCPFVNSDIRETGTVKLSAFGVQGEEDNEDE
ncbi:MAG: PD-(D/E)XK nuclease family protein, partial [Clostridia bacterium]